MKDRRRAATGGKYMAVVRVDDRQCRRRGAGDSWPSGAYHGKCANLIGRQRDTVQGGVDSAAAACRRSAPTVAIPVNRMQTGLVDLQRRDLRVGIADAQRVGLPELRDWLPVAVTRVERDGSQRSV